MWRGLRRPRRALCAVRRAACASLATLAEHRTGRLLPAASLAPLADVALSSSSCDCKPGEHGTFRQWTTSVKSSAETFVPEHALEQRSKDGMTVVRMAVHQRPRQAVDECIDSWSCQ